MAESHTHIFLRFTCIALLALPLGLHGQNQKKIESLKKSLAKTSGGVTKYNLLNDLAWEYRFAYPDSTIIYSKNAYTLGKMLNLQTDLAKSLNFLGVAYNYKGDRLKAYDSYMQAIKVSGEQKDSLQNAHSNNNIGRLLFEQGLLSKSYEYYLKASAIFKKKKDDYGLAYTLQSIGNLEIAQKDFVKAEQNYKEALALRLKQNEERGILAAYILLSRLYYEKKDYEKSNAALLKADSAGQRIHDEINLAEIRTLLAKNYLEQDRIKEAEEAAESGAKVIQKFQSIRILSETYLILGKIKLKQANNSMAESYFKTSLEIATKINDLQAQMRAYEQLWHVADSKNQKSQATEYMNQYLLRKDSIKDLDLTRQVERLQFQVQIEQKEKENDLLKLQQAQQESVIAAQRIQNILLFAVVVLAFSLTGIFWLNSKRRRKTSESLETKNRFIEVQRQQIEKRNTDLSGQNQKLADLNHEKDMLMNIVAHDLKSPLNRMIGLITLTQMEGHLLPTQEEFLRLMKEVSQSNLDLIKDLLDVNAWDVEKEIGQTSPVDLGKLLEDRIANFQYAANSKEIVLTLAHKLESNALTNPGYISRIVDNLVSNAIKFSKRGTHVHLAAMLESKTLILKVKDEGPGFSSQDKELLFQRFKKLSARPTGGETSNGLGLAIVKTLVDRLKGEIELTTSEGKGSEFIIQIPVRIEERVNVQQ